MRGTDVWDLDDESVTVLCRGADTQTVREMLDRLGVPSGTSLDGSISMAVARTSDLLRLRPATQDERV